VSFNGVGGHSAVPLWTSMSAAFMGTVLNADLEFQLTFLLYSGANSNHHPLRKKPHQKIVLSLFLVIACPPAAMIT